MEEVFWAQIARKDWTKKGDRNTRYFHAIVCKRRATNRITGLKNHSDQWIDEDQKLRELYNNISKVSLNQNQSKVQRVLWRY